MFILKMFENLFLVFSMLNLESHHTLNIFTAYEVLFNLFGEMIISKLIDSINLSKK